MAENRFRGGNYPQGNDQPRKDPWQYGEIDYSEDWIKDKISGDAIAFAKSFSEEVLADRKGGISTSQFRNIYGEIKRIQLKGFENEKSAFHLLRPKVAYAVKRSESNGSKKFKDLLEKLHEAVDADKAGASARYENFCDFIEALLAFHKAAGGKN